MLFKLEPELLLPPLPSLCKHARSSNPFTFAAASVPRRRRDFIATDEGLVPPLSFLASWVRKGLTELVLPQVYVPGARRSHAPTTLERCRSAVAADPRPAASSTLVSSSSSSLSGEQKPPLNFPSSCAPWCIH
jgi:hypothetical protein